jgi:hypothetical protein
MSTNSWYNMATVKTEIAYSSIRIDTMHNFYVKKKQREHICNSFLQAYHVQQKCNYEMKKV